MPRQPRIGSSRLQEGGLLATNKQDFNSHVEGGGFRHTADHIDMNPSLSQFNASDVQGTLELIAGFAASAGSGFVSVGNQTGDGYATGSYNVTSSVSFRQALISAFSDTRLQNGGYVLVLNGTYRLDSTVEVPPGITLIGEPAGSVIIGETSNIPMFSFQAGVNFPLIGGNQGSGQVALNQGAPIDSSGLRTLILADNLDGYSSGQPTLPSSTMVQIETGANVKISDVKFLGRIEDGLLNPAAGRDKTLRAIETTLGNSTATSLEVSGCFFDGISQPIRFTPGSGNADKLIIKNNKARVFGLENSGNQTDTDNSFCAFSLCDLNAVNNFIVTSGSSGDFVTNCFTVISNGSGSTDVSMLIANTTGRSSSSVLTGTRVFTDSVGTANYKVVQDNNNWGSDVNNPWYVTVGEGGDFQGPGALNLVFNSSFNYPTDIYILPGTYTVTANGSSSYNLIGLDTGSTYPTIVLNLSSAPTDEVNNDILNCGQRIKNLAFEVSSSWHSIRPGGTLGGAKSVEISNCTFTNVGVSVNNAVSSSLPNKIELNNCYFIQDGTYDDNIDLLLPSVDNVLIKNSTFTGYGYVGLIGDDSSLSYTTSAISDILIEGCVFDQVGYTIDDASPLTIEAFLSIQDNSGKVTLRNNRFIVAEDNQLAPIVSNTRTDADFESYVNINANIIEIENNDFNCAYTLYDVSSTNYILPGLFLRPVSSLRLSNSYFYNCLCQVGSGTSVALDGRGDGIYINNCFFLVNDSGYSGTTVLDIDVDPPADTPSMRKVLLSNNSYYVRPSDEGAPILAYHAESGTYTTVGVVQVFADDVPVYIRGNSMDSNMPALGTDTVISGFVVNNRTVDENLLPACQITDNDIYVINNFTSGDNTEVGSAIYVNCTNLQVLNNEIALNNAAGVAGSNQICCLYILTNQNISGEDPIKALVKGNNFSRRNKSSGAAVSLTSFVRIDGASEPGVATDNVFSDDTTDGTIETVFSDDSSSWASFNNINEFYTISTNGEMGTYGVSNAVSNDLWYPVIGDDNGPSVESYITVDLNGSGQRVTFAYDTDDSRAVFKWYLSLNGIIPWGANIAEVTVDVDATSNPATLDDVLLQIVAGGGSGADSSNITTAGDTLTVTSSTLRMGSGSENYVVLQAILESGSNLSVFTTGPLTIKYKL